MKKHWLGIRCIIAILFIASFTYTAYGAESSVAPIEDNITVTNIVGKVDTVYVTELSPGDVVKVYDAATKGRVLGSMKVSSQDFEVTLKVALPSSGVGSIYVTVTSAGMTESSRTMSEYDAEPITAKPEPENIEVSNNARRVDTVYVSNLSPGDIVKVYNLISKGKVLGSAKVSSSKYEATVTIPQLGTKSGSVYVSVRSIGERESSRVMVGFEAEEKTGDPNAEDVTVYNNANKRETVYVINLCEGDIVKVYSAVKGGKLLGSKTVGASKTEVSFNLNQLSTAQGSIYVSVTSNCKYESNRIKVDYAAKSKSKAVTIENVSITNNAISDTVYVNNVAAGSVIKVYDAAKGGNSLGTVTVSTTKNEATLTIKQLGTEAGSVYIAVTSKGMLESDRIKVEFAAESQSNAIDANSVSVTNNTGKYDTVNVVNLSDGEIVKVYDAAQNGKLLGTATVAASSTEVTISIRQLGTSAGFIYVSKTENGKQDSSKTAVSYTAEGVSPAINANNVTISNNSGVADIIKIVGLVEGDTIKVYDAENAGTIIGTGKVPTSGTEVSISISQLGTAAGSVYISNTGLNKQASMKVAVAYPIESKSTSSVVSGTTITNNAAGTADTIKVTGLSAGDIVKVYDAIIAGNMLGTGTVSGTSTEVTITISQLGASAGKVYISITTKSKQESDRTETAYFAEAQSDPISASNITIINNVTTSDVVKVLGLSSSGCIIKVYDAATGGTLLGSATVPSGSTVGSVNITQLGAAAGSVYVTATTTAKLESGRTKANYADQATSTAPAEGNITIVNNAGKAGTITVSGLVGGDIINVYDMATGGNLLGTAVVGTYDTQAVVSVNQLGFAAGSVFVSVTNTGKNESARVEAKFSAKTQTIAMDASNVIIDNNALIADTITVSNLNAGDVIKVYNAASGGELIGTAAVASGSMQVIISVTQLSIGAGNVYITNTTSGKIESSRTTCSYTSETATDAPIAGNITIENNSGSSDKITITGLLVDDVVKIYTASTGGNLIGTATVASGNTEATIAISQIGSSAGSIYITVTSKGRTESSRTKADYKAESASLVVANITIENNAVISDKVTVTGLVANDVVNVYDAAQNGNLLGTAIVASSGNSATVTISQLTVGAGSVYVSVTSYGMSESIRTKVGYVAEQTSNTLYPGNVTIVNNKAGTFDTITVSGLESYDLINVYTSSTGATILGSATSGAGVNQVTIKIPQLGTDAGSVYITITNLGKYESNIVKINYTAEP